MIYRRFYGHAFKHNMLTITGVANFKISIHLFSIRG